LAGFPVVYEYINTGNAQLSILLVGNMIYDYDVISSDIAFNLTSHFMRRRDQNSCFTCFIESYDRARSTQIPIPTSTQLYRETYTEPSAPTQPQIVQVEPSSRTYQTINISPSAPPASSSVQIFTVQEIWNGFFEMCEKSACGAVTTNLISIDDFESCEPYLFIGLSSLVAFEAIERSMDTNGIKLHSGKIVNIYTRPTDTFSTTVYDTVIDIKGKFKELNPTHRELIFIRKWLITVGDEAKCVQYMKDINSERLTSLKQFMSYVQSLGTNVTKAPTFHRLFGNTINKVVAQKDNLKLNYSNNV
jgi:hypothetical protein